MRQLIDREEVLKLLARNYRYGEGREEFKLLVQALPTHKAKEEWIRMDERLPTEEECKASERHGMTQASFLVVYTVVLEGEIHKAVAKDYYDKHSGQFCMEFDERFSKLPRRVTHWRNIPQPPEVEK